MTTQVEKDIVGQVEAQLEAIRDHARAEADREFEVNMDALQRCAGKLRAVYEELLVTEDEGRIEELEEEAAELAEYLEIDFEYVRVDGQQRTYTPEAWWEPSGGCEWVESAQYGYDFGWNVF